MRRVRITAKPKYAQNYITVSSPQKPELSMEGGTVTGLRTAEPEPAKRKPARVLTVPIPETADTIGNNAFANMEQLRSAYLGHTPCRLGSGVFSGCAGLENAVLGEGITRIPLETFSNCGKLRAVHLPNSVTRINMDAFKNCVALRSVHFPPLLEIIEASAFWGCRSLEKAVLPDSVTEIRNDAFANCTGLTQVQLPASLKKIGACAFQNCTNLETIVIPEGVTALPLGVFAHCRNLKQVILPDTLEHISPYAFYRCDALESVECSDPERFAQALEETPFWWKNWLYPQKPDKFPMELLNQFAGEVPGTMLCAMGYSIFDLDMKYRFFLSDCPGVIQVRFRPLDAEYPENADYGELLVNEALEPIPDLRPSVNEINCEAVF